MSKHRMMTIRARLLMGVLEGRYSDRLERVADILGRIYKRQIGRI